MVLVSPFLSKQFVAVKLDEDFKLVRKDYTNGRFKAEQLKRVYTQMLTDWKVFLGCCP